MKILAQTENLKMDRKVNTYFQINTTEPYRCCNINQLKHDLLTDISLLCFLKLLKPQVERRRRERMNRSLENLKLLLLQGPEHNVRTSLLFNTMAPFSFMSMLCAMNLGFRLIQS